MNKFIILIVAAIAIGSIRAAQLKGSGEEAANVLERELLFRDYCLEADATIKDFVKDKLDGTGPNIYRIMMNTKLDEEAQSEATEEQDGPMEDGIAERAAAVKSAVDDVLSFANDVDQSELKDCEELLDFINSDKESKEVIDEPCDSISYDLKLSLDEQLDEAKNRIRSASSPDNKQLDHILKQATIMNIGCPLTRRVGVTANFCAVVRFFG